MQSHLGNHLIICLRIKEKEIMLTNGRAIWGKCPNFPKGLFLSQGTLVASSETVIAQFDKKNQFGTSAFSHNSNFKFWSGGTFYANSGSQGHWLRNSGSFRNVTNIFLLVDLGQNWLNTTNLLLFQFHYQLHWRKMNLCGKEWDFTWLVMLDNKN